MKNSGIIYNFSLKDFLRDEFTGSYDAALIDDGNMFLEGEYLVDTYALYTGVLNYSTFITRYAGLISVISSAEVKKLLADYILPTLGEETIVQSENESVGPNDDVKERIIKICGYFVKTYPYFKKMIDIYAAELDNLMKPVKSKSKTAFSDMPQTATFANLPTSDVVSTYTENENETELASKIARINEIKNNMENVYKTWLNDFAKTFIIY